MAEGGLGDVPTTPGPSPIAGLGEAELRWGEMLSSFFFAPSRKITQSSFLLYFDHLI